MTNVYKIKLFRWAIKDKDNPQKELGKKDKDEYRNFCLTQNIVAVGWPAKRDRIYESAESYIQAVEGMFPEPYKSAKSWHTARNAFKDMVTQESFVWTWTDGNTYYLGKIKAGEKLLWNSGEHRKTLENKLAEYRQNEGNDPNHKIDLDEFGLWVPCQWKKIEQFDEVPGNVIARFRQTICQVKHDDGYSKFLYDPESSQLSASDFWNWAHYDDLEDLVGLYLQKEEGYFMFPSTNKQSTKDYEFELVHHSGDKKAIIQCKHKGKIDTNRLKQYKKDIYLLNVKTPVVINEPKDWTIMIDGQKCIMGKTSKYKDEENIEHNIFVFDSKKLKEWASEKNNKENRKILPVRIQKFLNFSK